MQHKKNSSLILALETSGAACGVAVSEDTGIIAEYTVFINNLHDKLLAELIKRILDDSGITIQNIDAVAVSAGPGSFTGLRIGGSIAKALCYEEHPRLISVPTLKAIAYSAKEFAKALNRGEIVSVIPSHKDLIYFQRFSSDMKELSTPDLSSIEDMKAHINENILLCGPASSLLIENPINIVNKISPSVIARYGYELYKAGEFTSAQEFVPVYVQEFEPKTKKWE